MTDNSSRIQLPIRLGKEKNSPNVIACLEGGMGLEDLVLGASSVFLQDPLHSAGPSVVGGEGVHGIAAETVQQPPEVGGAQARVDPRIVEKRLAVTLSQDRTSEAPGRRGHQLRQPERPGAGVRRRLEDAFLPYEAAQEGRLEAELGRSVDQEAAFFDRIVEAPPGIGHPPLSRRSHLGKSSLGRGNGRRKSSQSELSLRQSQIAAARTGQSSNFRGRVTKNTQAQKLVRPAKRRRGR